MNLRPNFIQIPSVKTMINIGALLDIPTGTYIKGLHGEHVLNGGLGGVTGVVGIGNNFKSTFMHFMMLSACDRISQSVESSMGTYDTEVNFYETRAFQLTKRFKAFMNENIMDSGLWNITDKTIYLGNKWYEVLKTFLKEKRAAISKIQVSTPFPDRDGKSNLMIPPPTFGEIDSVTMFETDQAATMQDENELGASGANTLHMRLGGAKTRLLMELPGITGAAYHYMLLSAHIGKNIEMNTGPMPVAPVKKLQYLKNGDVIKGVSDKFFFLLANCWHAFNATPLLSDKKTSLYPSDPNDNKMLDTDLNVVTLRQLRSKSGPTGYTLELIVSQVEGVLPELSEFHYIKTQDYYGFTGSQQNYVLDILPEVKLSRTTIRSKIDSNPDLCRALNITSEMCQMKNFWRHLSSDILCTPKELYDGLIAKGYDWNVLLKTRGWWTVNNDKHPVPFLSTMDLLMMNKGQYIPYWFTEEQKSKIKG